MQGVARARRIDGSVSLLSTAMNIVMFAHDICSRFCPPAERTLPQPPQSREALKFRVFSGLTAHTFLQRAASWKLCISISCNALVHSLKSVRLRSRVDESVAPSYTIVCLQCRVQQRSDSAKEAIVSSFRIIRKWGYVNEKAQIHRKSDVSFSVHL